MADVGILPDMLGAAVVVVGGGVGYDSDSDSDSDSGRGSGIHLGPGGRTGSALENAIAIVDVNAAATIAENAIVRDSGNALEADPEAHKTYPRPARKVVHHHHHHQQQDIA